jgi:hypothetical protein
MQHRNRARIDRFLGVMISDVNKSSAINANGLFRSPTNISVECGGEHAVITLERSRVAVVVAANFWSQDYPGLGLVVDAGGDSGA